MNNPLATIGSVAAKINGITGILLVTPKVRGYQPQNPINPLNLPSPIIFHYEGEQQLNLQSDITDHYVEDNYTISDHIALRPETVTTHGFVGELFDALDLGDLSNSLIGNIAQSIPSKLTAISAYQPGLSATALRQYNQAKQIYENSKKAAESIVSSLASIKSNFFGGDAPQNKQQTYFNQFYGYWEKRTLFSIQTPWNQFDDMAIESLRAIQDADTSVITDFEVTFKKIRVATTKTIRGFDLNNFSGRARNAAASATNSTTVATVSNVTLNSKIA